MGAAVSITDLENALLDLQTIQSVANDPGPTVTSRLGASFYTLQGLLALIGYLPPVNYAGGLNVNSPLYTVLQSGLVYAPDPSLVPFTTPGSFNSAQWFIVQVAPSTFMKTVLTAVDAATARGTLGAAASGANTDLTSLLLNNTGLKVKGTSGSNGLILKPGSVFTADRTLTLTPGDNNRTLDISAANVTISSFIATLLDDADAATAQTTLGMSTFFKTLLASADAPTFRANFNDLTPLFFDIGDETTTITTGNSKAVFRAPFSCTIIGSPRASLTTASSSGLPTFRLNKNGVSMMSTLLTIDAAELTSNTASTACVMSSTTVGNDDQLSIDITVAGTGAKGAKVMLLVLRTT